MTPPARRSILIVDDDEDLRESMMILLQLSGFSPQAAANGREALESIARSMPDLILLDMRMPIMDGWEFARRFHETYGHVRPIIVVTAADDARRSAREIGATGAIGKPFDAAALVGEISRHL